MEQSRFIELKNGMYLIRQKDLRLSAIVDTRAINDKSELKYQDRTPKYKELHASDLPIFRKWICGDTSNYYRGRIIDGRLICDKIHIGNNEISYGTLTLNSVMNDNKLSNETEFNNAICKLITYLEK